MGQAGVRGFLEPSGELIRGLETVLLESRNSRPRRGTEAGALGGQRGGRVWGRREQGCQILAVWDLRTEFGSLSFRDVGSGQVDRTFATVLGGNRRDRGRGGSLWARTAGHG